MGGGVLARIKTELIQNYIQTNESRVILVSGFPLSEEEFDCFKDVMGAHVDLQFAILFGEES